jgi:single-strand DNA-binding protein
MVKPGSARRMTMLNTAILMGRLTAEPELKSTPSGLMVCSFTLAVERSAKGKDGNRQTDFIRCVAWRERAEFLEKYFSKGSMVAVQGSIQVRSYEDKHGNKREAVEVVVDQLSFTGEKRDPGRSAAIQPDSDFEEILADDDLPF